MRKSIPAAVAVLAMATTMLTGSAQAGGAEASSTLGSEDELALFETVQSLIRQENSLTLSNANVTTARAAAKANPRAAAKLDKRAILKAGVRQSNRAAGVSFSSVETSFVLKDVSATPTGGKTLVVDELTRYPMPDGQDYEYRVEHTANFESTPAGWAVADLATDSAASEVGEPALAAAGNDPQAHVAAGVARVRQAKVALDANRGVLRAIDESKMADRGAGLTDEARTASEASGLARPSGQPARLSTDALSVGPGKAAGDGITPYEYSEMVRWAKYYAKDNPVTYTRDTNDCTTFVSWAMWKGGWAETGAQSYPSVSWNVDNDDVWYWRCNDCTPRHSYTWGGAINWARFAKTESNRLRLLSYTTDLSSAADVMQMEIDGYGSSNLQDHTMITTGRNSAGWVLLSYHSTDTLNKPLNLILSAHNGPYWAWRT